MYLQMTNTPPPFISQVTVHARLNKYWLVYVTETISEVNKIAIFYL